MTDTRHTGPKTGQDEARLPVVFIVVCAGYILSMELLALAYEGPSLGRVPETLLALLVLAGAVRTLQNRPPGLFLLATSAKIYAALLVIAYAARLTITGRYGNAYHAWFYLAALLYLALTDVLPALRRRAFLPPAGAAGTWLRIAAFTVPPILLLVSLFGWMTVRIPAQVRSLRTVDYGRLLAGRDLPPITDYRWQDEHRVFLRRDMEPDGRSPDGPLLWRNGRGEVISLGPGIMAFDLYPRLAALGYRSPYQLEKAIWNADLKRTMLLVMKGLTAPGDSPAVYHLESDRFNAIIITGRSGVAEKWAAELHLFPTAGGPLSMASFGPTLDGALAPVLLTVERWREGYRQQRPSVLLSE